MVKVRRARDPGPFICGFKACYQLGVKPKSHLRVHNKTRNCVRRILVHIDAMCHLELTNVSFWRIVIFVVLWDEICKTLSVVNQSASTWLS